MLQVENVQVGEDFQFLDFPDVQPLQVDRLQLDDRFNSTQYFYGLTFLTLISSQ